LDSGYPKSQLRNVELATQLTAENEFEKATSVDMLYDLAWFNLGVQKAKENDSIHAYVAFVFAGLLRNQDIESWVNATLCGFSADAEISLLIFTIRTAYHYNGYEYVSILREQVKTQNSNHLDVILELIDQTTLLPKKEPIIIRLHDDAGEYTKIVL
jgi:hypothetical protein